MNIISYINNKLKRKQETKHLINNVLASKIYKSPLSHFFLKNFTPS